MFIILFLPSLPSCWSHLTDWNNREQASHASILTTIQRISGLNIIAKKNTSLCLSLRQESFIDWYFSL